ncbi:MAG: hypothetical protein D6788_07475 [Planctomycetota bacterium]|nr:MAG: hypothetical protein D6788_07475 [Planctomycetota bacterium]
MTIKETVDAKARLGAEDALALARSASTVVIAKGKKVVRFAMKKNPPTDEELLAHMLGPTGRLRAPTIRKGKTLLVGFHEDVYDEVF